MWKSRNNWSSRATRYLVDTRNSRSVQTDGNLISSNPSGTGEDVGKRARNGSPTSVWSPRADGLFAGCDRSATHAETGDRSLPPRDHSVGSKDHLHQFIIVNGSVEQLDRPTAVSLGQCSNKFQCFFSRTGPEYVQHVHRFLLSKRDRQITCRHSLGQLLERDPTKAVARDICLHVA